MRVHAMSIIKVEHQLTYDAVVEKPDEGVLRVSIVGGLFGSGGTSGHVLDTLLSGSSVGGVFGRGGTSGLV